MKKAAAFLIIFTIIPFAGAYSEEDYGRLKQTLDSAYKVEEKINERSFWLKIFSGGDLEKGKELRNVLKNSGIAIEELEDCENCTKMIREYKRLEAVAAIEINRRGLFGWFRR